MAKAAQRCGFEVNVAKSHFIPDAPDLPFESQLYSPNDWPRSTTVTASFLRIPEPALHPYRRPSAKGEDRCLLTILSPSPSGSLGFFWATLRSLHCTRLRSIFTPA